MSKNILGIPQALSGVSHFLIEDMLETPNCINIFKLSKAHMPKTFDIYGKFILALIKSSVGKRAKLSPGKRLTSYVLVDEFQHFITRSVAEILSEMRKYNLFFTLAHQHLEQLGNMHFRSSVSANTSNKIAGYNDAKNALQSAKEMCVSKEEIQKLATGKFLAKFQKLSAQKIQVPAFRALIKTNTQSWYDDIGSYTKERYQDAQEAKKNHSTKVPFYPTF